MNVCSVHGTNSNVCGSAGCFKPAATTRVLPPATCENMLNPLATLREDTNARAHLFRALALARRAAVRGDFALVRQWMQDAQRWLDKLEGR